MTTHAKQGRIVPWLQGWGLLPPLAPEPLSALESRRVARAFIAFNLAAVALDLVIYFALRNVAAMSRHALVTFMWINVPNILLSSAVLYVEQLLPAVPRRRLEPFLAAHVGLLVIVWVQMTGTVTSYFFVAALAQTALFRAVWGYRAGMASMLTVLTAHVCAFALENAGVLPRTPLLRDPGNAIDSVPEYRNIAMASIAYTYVLGYVGASVAILYLRAQRREFERVRRDLAGLADGLRRGRLSGTELGRWFIDELLGRGGMGEVYAAHDERGTQVAIKLLHPHLADDETALRRFEQEQLAAERVGSTHFPKLLEVSRSDDGAPYFVMERLTGEDLGALLRRRRRLEVNEVLELSRALGQALDALHAHGITHRDLTPGNVFIVASTESSWPDLRLLDLGICKLRDTDDAITRTTALLGTPGYMAPEQIDGPLSSVGAQTDVFACAAMLYRALVGEVPFPAATVLESIESVCRRDPVPATSVRSDLPRAVDGVFARALAKKPSERFSSAGTLFAALSDALRGELAS